MSSNLNLDEAIRAASERVLEKFNITGLSVGVVFNNEVIVFKGFLAENMLQVAFLDGFGFADKEHQEIADADTLYQIASNSKAFTAMLAVIGEEGDKQPFLFQKSIEVGSRQNV